MGDLKRTPTVGAEIGLTNAVVYWGIAYFGVVVDRQNSTNPAERSIAAPHPVFSWLGSSPFIIFHSVLRYTIHGKAAKPCLIF
jgi:hypothetical protein